jgi:hypothetical protein
MPIERVSLLGRAKYAIDLAVHELHTRMLEPVFADFRKSQCWCNLFTDYPSLKGKKAFFREMASFRSILPIEAQASLDTETVKIRTAFSLAQNLNKANEAARSRVRQKQSIPPPA